ncbi:LapA family protein [Micromonospora siamensis]|uniref:LapA family protein n=1 Tax=Micromonospora siamensis TaxID=299152 RepID=UPI0012FDE0EC|nr:LapA family protein [Micromonospora siamensis]
MSTRSGSWVTAAFFWLLGPLVIVFCLGGGILGVGPAWRAQFGEGTTGTFTADRTECRKGCLIYGDFVSADGGVSRSDVLLLDGPERMDPGATEPAKYTGGESSVYSTSGGASWLWVLGMALVGAVVAVGWLAFGISWLRARRRRSA